jgi:hypothetical protein
MVLAMCFATAFSVLAPLQPFPAPLAKVHDYMGSCIVKFESCDTAEHM